MSTELNLQYELDEPGLNFAFEHEDSYRLPEHVNDYDNWDSFFIGMGKRFNDAGAAFKKLISTKEGKAKIDAMLEEENRLYREGIANPMSSKKGWTEGGELGADIAMSGFLPNAVAKGVLGRAIQNGLLGAGFEALTNPNDRVDNALKGAAGGTIGSVMLDTVGKAAAGRAKKFINPVQMQVRDRMRKFGLSPLIGDIAAPNSSRVTRTLESLTDRGHFADEAEKMKKLLVPNRVSKKNVVTEGVRSVDEALKGESNRIWSGFNSAVSKPSVMGVKPTELHTSLRKLYEEYPQTLSQTAVPNAVLRQNLLDLAQMKPNQVKAMDINEYNTLRKALGSALSGVRTQATPIAAGGAAPLDKKAVSMFEDMYRSTHSDISRWGKNGRNKKAYELFRSANTDWEETVLPWRKNPIAKELAEVGESGANETARILATNPDTILKEEVRDYLRKYGNYDSGDLYEAMLQSPRSTKVLSGVDDGELDSLQSATRDIVSSVVGPLSLSKRPGFQDFYFGDPSWLRQQGGLDIGVGNLKNFARGVPLAISREYGGEEAAMAGMLHDLFGFTGGDDSQDNDPGFQHGIGHATQQGVMGR